LDKSLGISFHALSALCDTSGRSKPAEFFSKCFLIYGSCGNTETSVLFSSASFVSAFGSFLTYVALQVQIYSLTNLPPVALLGAVQLVPLGVTALWGGALADALDRRRLLPCCEVLLLCGSLSLAVNSMLPHPSEPFLFIVAAFMSAVGGFHTPALESLTPSRVEFRQLARRIYGGAVRSCTLDRLRGLVCVVGVLACVPLLPAFWRYRREETKAALAQSLGQVAPAIRWGVEMARPEASRWSDSTIRRMAPSSDDKEKGSSFSRTAPMPAWMSIWVSGNRAVTVTRP
jgi:MFS family permease